MTAREVTVLAYAMATEGRTETELAELEDFLNSDPAERAERDAKLRLEAIARMGGDIGGGDE
jgi:hypothetical protein